MKKSKIKNGRAKQKYQTRLDILDAAKALMKEEKKITLEDVAKKANISRATVYRYYSNIDLLFTEATLDLHHKSSDQIYDQVKGLKFTERILFIQKHYTELALKNETVFRRYLSAVLSESIITKEQLRGARRVKSLNKALETYKDEFTKSDFKKLIDISSVLMGIDATIACKDVCNLDDKETEDTLRWAMEMILKGMSLEK
ncbi:MAG: TetR/AcrR family transcriptional regulator [Chlorobiota bacterium]